MTCTDKEGDCNSAANTESDEEDSLSDSELVVVAFAVPLLIVGLGGAVWYLLSKRAVATNKPPLAGREVSNISEQF
jgi:hypothetical protein